MTINTDYYYYYLPIILPQSSILPITLQYPIYQPSLSFIQPVPQDFLNVQNAAESIREGASNLIEALSERSLITNQEGITGEVERGAPLGEYEINVIQLAREQVNTGNWLNVTSLNFQLGEQTFKITAGGIERYFTVNVTSESNNLSVLDEIARQINEAGVGIEATVEIEGSQARIVLRGETGSENAFSVEDVTGNLVATSGMSNVTQTAQNLVFQLNGVQYENPTNTITQIPGVSLNVEQVGEYTVVVTYNADEIRNALENMLQGINELAQYQNLLNPAAAGLLQTIMQNPLLESAGIENVGGRLQIAENFEEIFQNPSQASTVTAAALENIAMTAQNLAEMTSVSPSMLQLPGSYPIYGYPYKDLLTLYYLYPSYSNLLNLWG